MTSSLDTAPAALQRAVQMQAEVEEGNIEYKYKLTNLTNEQLAHRITQLNWRLNEGNNEAVYKIGVRDDGYPVGLSDEDLEESLSHLHHMSTTLRCRMRVSELLRGSIGKVAIVHFQRLDSSVVAPVQLDVCVAGDSNSGKSTLIGVLVHGQLDNGRGSARTQVLKHNHEIATGHTSSISHHFLFLDEKGQVLKPNSCTSAAASGIHAYHSGDAGPTAMLMKEAVEAHAAEEEHLADERAADSIATLAPCLRLRAMSEEDILRETHRSVSFIDLAGHEKYLKTAMHGLVGRAPQFCLLTISAASGGRPEEFIGLMAREHLALASAMKLRVIIAVTKADTLSEAADLTRVLTACCAVLRACGTEGAVLRSTGELQGFLDFEAQFGKRAPIFVVSNVSGEAADNSISMLETTAESGGAVVLILDQFRVGPRDAAPTAASMQVRLNDGEVDQCQIGGIPQSSLILFGSIQSGTIEVGDEMLYGPNNHGAFFHVEVYSIHVNRVSLHRVGAGRCACFAVREALQRHASNTTDAFLSTTYSLASQTILLPLQSEPTASSRFINSVPDVSATSHTDKAVLMLREELRICNKNDPRRRKLRVDDPEHPSNKIQVPLFPTSPLNVSMIMKDDSKECIAKNIYTGALKRPLRTGMVMISPVLQPVACSEFDANILVLNHPKRISINYEPVVHGLGARQCAKIISINKLVEGAEGGAAMSICNGERAICRFRFLYHPEYLPVGTNIVLREGRTRAIGVVTAVRSIEECRE